MAMASYLTSQQIGYGATALGVLGFSTKAIFAKLVYPYGVDPITLMTIRSLVAMPVLWMLLVATREPALPLGGVGWLRLAWAGVAGYYIAPFLDFYGLQTITATLERLILFLYPCFVVILGAIVARRRLSLATLAALLLAYVGVIVTVVAGGWSQIGGDWVGLLLVLGAAMVFATYYIIAGNLARRLSAIRFSTYLMSIAGGATIIHFLVVRSAWDLFALPIPVYLYGVALGVVSTVLPIILVTEGLRRIDTNSSAAINMLGPVFTFIMAYSLLGESLELLQFVGFAMVLFGVFALGRSFRPVRDSSLAAVE